jgi:hypothetical protein
MYLLGFLAVMIKAIIFLWRGGSYVDLGFERQREGIIARAVLLSEVQRSEALQTKAALEDVHSLFYSSI